jgi:hypothetical protein
VRDFDLFEFYRFILTVLVTTYGIIRLVMFIWHWRGAVGQARGGTAILYRYAAVLLLRARFRRFLYDAGTIGGLLAILALLIHLHWR